MQTFLKSATIMAMWGSYCSFNCSKLYEDWLQSWGTLPIFIFVATMRNAMSTVRSDAKQFIRIYNAAGKKLKEFVVCDRILRVYKFVFVLYWQ